MMLSCEKTQVNSNAAGSRGGSLRKDLLIEFPRSNYTPSEAEVTLARALLTSEESELIGCNEEVARIRDFLEQLEAKQSMLQGRVMKCRDFTSIRRRLPIEIWDEVFSLICLIDGFSLSLPATCGDGSAGATTLTLSQVCSLWRDVVTNTPKLWSSFALSITKISVPIQGLLSHYLRRSANHPLKIRAYHRDRGIYEDEEDSDDDLLAAAVGKHGIIAFRMLMSHCTRFQELELAFDNWDILDYLCNSRTRISFPELRSLTFRATIGGTGRAFWFWKEACTAPNLVALRSDKWEEYMSRSLVSLELDRWPHLLTFEQLGASTKLECLSIELFQGSATLSPVNFPRLQSLFLRRVDCHLDWFFGFVTLPSLVHLKIKYIFPRQPTALTSIVEMIQRSRCSLRTLEIACPGSQVRGSFKFVVDVLQVCPELTRLEVPYEEKLPYKIPLPDRPEEPQSDLIASLTATAQNAENILAPTLWSVALPISSNVSNVAFAERILTMVESRSMLRLKTFAGISILRWVTVKVCCDRLRMDRPSSTFYCECNPFSTPNLSNRMVSLEQCGSRITIEGSCGRPLYANMAD
ncbi:hypothetical protein VNI00_013451 [Paramarasmius palmivorus]|uniref:F-box domain-containing protein n=1 Tax=Paramarasmius palmivorus TaxID=297713 RepID=A0AAW0BZ94_9AGAR